MINLDDTKSLNRIADTLEDISRGLAVLYKIAASLEKIVEHEQICNDLAQACINASAKRKYSEQSNEKGNSNDNTETAEEV